MTRTPETLSTLANQTRKPVMQWAEAALAKILATPHMDQAIYAARMQAAIDRLRAKPDTWWLDLRETTPYAICQAAAREQE